MADEEIKTKTNSFASRW